MNLETNMGIEDMWKILKKQEAKKKSRLRDAPMNVTGILSAIHKGLFTTRFGLNFL